MPFGEYELSPSLIGLSLLRTPHPEAFQRLLGRASIPRYRDFTLGMRRSLGFASTPSDSTPSSGSLSLRVRASWRLASPDTVTRRFIMQKARRHRTKNRLRPLVGAWFQGLFHSPQRGAFHRSLTVLCAIGLTGVFSLAGWARRIHAGFLVPRATQDTACHLQGDGTGLSPSAARLSSRLPPPRQRHSRGPTTPAAHTRHATGLGWSPVARRYWGNHRYFLFLRVLRCFSSPGSPPHNTVRVTSLQDAGLSHSETPGSMAICA